jgi:hydroxymethylglutaryl-CoA synthase
MASRGVLSYGTYVPFRRLDRSGIAPVAGRGGGTGTRSVASYDEDTTTMGVEAARGALASLASLRSGGAGAGHAGAAEPGAVWFATTAPAYADRTNATAIHAALRLDPAVPAFDAVGSVRSAVGALRAGLTGAAGDPALVVTADIRTGLPGGPDEAAGGDAAAALVVGAGREAAMPLLAEVRGWGSATDELLDRWRRPGDLHSKVWEERFAEAPYVACGQRAVADALKAAGLAAGQLDHVLVVGSHARACTRLRRSLGLGSAVGGADQEAWLLSTVGFTGAAHPGLALAAVLDVAGTDETIALVVLADGADAVILRTTADLPDRRPGHPGARPAEPSPARPAGEARQGGQVRSLAAQVTAGAPVSYGTYLAWRGLLPVEPPRRPEPARPSAAASHRSVGWKFGFVGSQAGDGTVHLPPAPGDEIERPMAGALGTIATYTVDRMAYSPSPPVVFAVVDFDGGGRLPVELTDVDATDVRIGQRVELTFRRLFTADGIHNYFWKARPLRDAGDVGERGGDAGGGGS